MFWPSAHVTCTPSVTATQTRSVEMNYMLESCFLLITTKIRVFKNLPAKLQNKVFNSEICFFSPIWQLIYSFPPLILMIIIKSYYHMSCLASVSTHGTLK